MSDPSDTDPERRCWLVQTGETNKQADRERLKLTEEAADQLLDKWRGELGTDDRWFSVTRMHAVVAESEDEGENE